MRKLSETITYYYLVLHIQEDHDKNWHLMSLKCPNKEAEACSTEPCFSSIRAKHRQNRRSLFDHQQTWARVRRRKHPQPPNVVLICIFFTLWPRAVVSAIQWSFSTARDRWKEEEMGCWGRAVALKVKGLQRQKCAERGGGGSYPPALSYANRTWTATSNTHPHTQNERFKSACMQSEDVIASTKDPSPF